MIKERLAQISNRGVYIQDKELKQTNFEIGKRYVYQIDQAKRRIIILPSENGKNTVSKRIDNPVIDIRAKQVLETFKDCEQMKVEIYEGQIIVQGIVKTGKAKSIKATFPMDYLQAFNEQIDLFDLIDVPKTHHNGVYGALQVVSLFSGAGMLDKGFIEEGFEIVYANELNPSAVQTYRANIGNHIEQRDINDLDLSTLPKVPIIIGGCPCQGFSNSNRYTNFLDNPNNLLVKKYIEAVQKNDQCKLFVIENVPQILTAGNGRFLNEIKEQLQDFAITYGVLNANQYGSAQARKRAFIIGSKIGRVSLPFPTHFEGEVTVADAFKDLEGKPNQEDYSKSESLSIERMKHVPPGGNVHDIPKELKPKGNHSDMYKRLRMDKPSCTIVNPRKSMLLHPLLNRILSVRECARLFDLADDFIFKGKLSDMQQQVANGVPVKLARAIARQLKKVIFRQSIPAMI